MVKFNINRIYKNDLLKINRRFGLKLKLKKDLLKYLNDNDINTNFDLMELYKIRCISN